MQLSTAVGTTVATAVLAAVDAGSAEGHIDFFDGTSLMVSVLLDDPSFSQSGKELTMLSVPLEGEVGVAGTIDSAKIYDSDDNEVGTPTVGTSGAEINLSSLTYSVGDFVRITSGTITVT